MRRCTVILSVLMLLCSCEVSWLDAWNDIWVLEPIYLSSSAIDFGETDDDIDFHIANNGTFNEVSYSISVEQDWINVVPLSGKVKKGDDVIINTRIDRSLLEEGRNTGKISVKIDGKEYCVAISATGVAILKINPEYIDFGASSSSESISVYSITGDKRLFNFYPQNEWISIDIDQVSLAENPTGINEKTKTLVVSCNRSLLDVGTYEGCIRIKSEKESFSADYKVLVTIPKHGEISQQIDDIVFSIKKTPYRNEDGSVSIKLMVENASSMYRTFSIVSSTSFATCQNGESYHVYSSSVNIKKKSSEEMELKVLNVPMSINMFSSLDLDFSLSEHVIFNNLSF